MASIGSLTVLLVLHDVETVNGYSKLSGVCVSSIMFMYFEPLVYSLINK